MGVEGGVGGMGGMCCVCVCVGGGESKVSEASRGCVHTSCHV